MTKKILFLYHTSTIGGGSFCLLNILKNIDRGSITPSVLLIEEGPLVKEIKNLGINVFFLSKMHDVPYNTTIFTISKIRNAFDIYCSLKQFEDLIKEIKPDVVYINTMMLYPYLRAAKRSRCRTVMHIREHWPEGEHSWQRNTALEHIAKYADEVIAINRYSASMIKSYNRTATIVYDWIDMTSRFANMPISSIFGENMNNNKMLLYMGGMQKIKGALEVVTAFSYYIKDEDYRLLILGIDPNFKSKGLRGAIKKILSFFGKKTYSDKVISLINSDKRIKCIPSLYNIRHLYEQAYGVISYFTIPHANLAMAESIICNTLSIAARTDESMEYSLEGDLAVLYVENDFDDFVKKILGIESYREDYLLKINARAKEVEIMFDPKQNIEKLNKILETI